MWAYNVWPPYICGMLVGGLQVPMVLIMSETLGGSSSLSFVVAQLFIGPLEKLSSYAAKFRRWNIGNYWQVLMSHDAELLSLLLYFDDDGDDEDDNNNDNRHIYKVP